MMTPSTLPTTEQAHPLTSSLSQTFEKDAYEGLKQLFHIDQVCFESFENGADFERIGIKALQGGGRLILIGAGSSGRLGVDVAARWKSYWDPQDVSRGTQVIGLMAGGIEAFVRPQEGIEDSFEEGERCLEELNITAKDTLICLSASGSARFLFGCADVARRQGAQHHFIVTTQHFFPHTQAYFKTNHISPIILQAGPQAITGSTRLQATNVMNFFLSQGLNHCIARLQAEPQKKSKIPCARIAESLAILNRLIDRMVDTFMDSSPGYVTYLTTPQSLREALIDVICVYVCVYVCICVSVCACVCM